MVVRFGPMELWAYNPIDATTKVLVSKNTKIFQEVGILFTARGLEKRDDLRVQCMLFVDFKQAHRYGQLKSPRPARPGIEIEHAFFGVIVRNVRVSVEHGDKLCRSRVEVQCLQVVQHVNVLAFGKKDLSFGQLAARALAVYVAANGCHWRDLRELVENGNLADIAEMKYVVDAFERGKDFRAKKAVGVADDAEFHAFRISGAKRSFGEHIKIRELSRINETHAQTNWRHALATYTQPRVLQVLALGFSSGLPLLLTYSTLSAWLSTGGVRRAAIGTFALVGTPYAFKFLWSPLIDRVPPPLPLGRRRGWGITIQILLIGAILCLGTCDPKHNLPRMAVLAVIVAFLSASQDIVIDAWRVESLTIDQQGPGAALVTAGYRIAMLVSGAGSLFIAAYAGWFAAYATMAALMVVGLLVFLFGPEPKVSANISYVAGSGWAAVRHAFSTAVIGPFRDFMHRPLWPVILIAIFWYKLGEAMAGVMSTPLYISLGFSLPEIATASKIFGVFSNVAGALIGGVVTTKFGIRRALILCGILQSIGNLFFVLQAVEGHRIGYLALCVTAENLTGAMALTALVTYLSSLCSPAFTATQYALLSSLALLGRTVVASSGGVLSEKIGWVRFFLFTSVVGLPALLLFLWIGPRDDARNEQLKGADDSPDPTPA